MVQRGSWEKEVAAHVTDQAIHDLNGVPCITDMNDFFEREVVVNVYAERTRDETSFMYFAC